MNNRKTYDEISPITNNLCVLVDKDESNGLESKLCMESGYCTNSFLVEGSKTVEQLKDQIPKHVYDLKVVDKGFVWILSMNSTEHSSIFPIMNGEGNDYIWQVVPLVKLREEEAKNYPNPERPGEFMDRFIDFDNALTFDKDKFEDAFNVFVNMSNPTNTIDLEQKEN